MKHWRKARSMAIAMRKQRDRADRHDRPRDGLRHNRHRPDFALVKFKKLAGGGYFKIINQSVPEALRMLATVRADRSDDQLCVGHGTLKGAPGVNPSGSRSRASPTKSSWPSKLRSAPRSTSASLQSLDLGRRVSAQSSEHDAERLDAPDFDLLADIGFTKSEIEAANVYCCGAMTLEGAPHINDEHLSVFDCANPCGKIGKRSLSSTVTFTCWRRRSLLSRSDLEDHQHAERSDVKDCADAYMKSWKLALKAMRSIATAQALATARLDDPGQVRERDVSKPHELVQRHAVLQTDPKIAMAKLSIRLRKAAPPLCMSMKISPIRPSSYSPVRSRLCAADGGLLRRTLAPMAPASRSRCDLDETLDDSFSQLHRAPCGISASSRRTSSSSSSLARIIEASGLRELGAVANRAHWP